MASKSKTYLASLNKKGSPNYVSTPDDKGYSSSSSSSGQVKVSSVGLTPEQTQQLQSIVNSNPAYAEAYKTGVNGKSVFNISDINKASPIITPNQTDTTQDFNDAVIAGNYGLGLTNLDGTSIQTTPTTTTETKTTTPTITSGVNLFDQYIKAKQGNKMPSLSEQYLKDEKSSKVNEYQQNVNDLQAKLKAISAKAQQSTLAVEGQGRGIPEVIIGGQQAQIKKEAAMEALSVQSELAAAQGQLEYAQNRLDTIFKLKSQDAQNEYDYTNKLIDSVYEYANEQQKNALEDKRQQTQNNLTLFRDNLSYVRDLSSKAFSDGNYTLSAKLGDYAGRMSQNNTDVSKLNSDLSYIMNTYGGNSLSSEIVTPYSGAINTILGSGKFTKDQTKMIKAAISNGDDPIAVIKNQAKNIMNQTQAGKLENYEVARDQIINIDSLLQEFYSKGGSTGIFSGNFEKALNNLGEISNPDLVSIATSIASALQVYRNAVSGTAYSVQEGKDIASIFPGINKSQRLNNAIIKGRLKAFDSTIDSMYKGVLGSAYDSIKSSSNYDNNTNDITITPEDEKTFDDVVGNATGGSGFWSSVINFFSGK